MNAARLLSAVGLPVGEDLFGSVAVAGLQDLKMSIQIAQNLPAIRYGMHVTERVVGNITTCGQGDEQAQRRLKQLLDLVEWCIENQEGLSWG